MPLGDKRPDDLFPATVLLEYLTQYSDHFLSHELAFVAGSVDDDRKVVFEAFVSQLT